LKKRTTILDIAKSLNVTAATVSRALNGSAEISEKTKTAVEAEAKRLNYHRNKLASSLRSGRTNIIGVMIPSADNLFFGSVVHGISNVAAEVGYDILIHQSNESQYFEEKGIHAFLGARVDGIVASIAKGTKSYDHFVEAKKRNIPMVLFDRINETLDIPSVVINDFKGAYLATEHLLQQGYTRIAHITGPQQVQAFSERLKGYKAALAKYRIKFDERLIFDGDISIQAGKDGTSYFLQQSSPPDAIFAVEDFTALGVLKKLKEEKIKVPHQVGVFGFCNDLFGEHITPDLSTIDQQTIVMGQEVFKMVFKLIDGKNIDKKIVLEPLPIIRSSSLRKK
jgi:LacI family transcriptional regulator